MFLYILQITQFNSKSDILNCVLLYIPPNINNYGCFEGYCNFSPIIFHPNYVCIINVVDLYLLWIVLRKVDE